MENIKSGICAKEDYAVHTTEGDKQENVNDIKSSKISTDLNIINVCESLNSNEANLQKSKMPINFSLSSCDTFNEESATLNTAIDSCNSKAQLSSDCTTSDTLKADSPSKAGSISSNTPSKCDETEDVTSTDASSVPSSSKGEPEYVFDGESYCYTDPKSGITYKYDNSKQQWVIKEESEEDEDKAPQLIKQDMTLGSYSFEGDTHIYTDPADGSRYMWDRDKRAWFPKIDEDFLALYQMNYGFVDPNPKTEALEIIEKHEVKLEDKKDLKRKPGPSEPNWFDLDKDQNTKIYVSNLPLDITEQEFIDIVQKCGLVMKDPDTGRMKIKLYTEPNSTELKGDGLCSYIRIESVDLALKILDGYEIRGNKLSVERAKFQMKGSYNPSLKPKKKRKKEKEKVKQIQEKLLDWRPDKPRGERAKHEKVVILKNLFDPMIFEKDVSLILEYQQDLREECSKCGDVKKVVVHDRHPEGVAQVSFREPEEADICVKFLNGRWFSQRKIVAETWDGKTKYKVAETEQEKQQRLDKWSKYLENEDKKKTEENKGKTN